LLKALTGLLKFGIGLSKAEKNEIVSVPSMEEGITRHASHASSVEQVHGLIFASRAGKRRASGLGGLADSKRFSVGCGIKVSGALNHDVHLLWCGLSAHRKRDHLPADALCFWQVGFF
jgi:hypothetical protein